MNNIEDLEKRIIDLQIERFKLIQKNNSLGDTKQERQTKLANALRIVEIGKEIEELIGSAKPNRC